MNRTTVLFYWNVPKNLQNYFYSAFFQYSNVELLFPSDATPEEYLGLVENADILVGWRPGKELLDKGKKLKLVINPGAGISHLLEMFRKLNEERELLLINGHGNSYFTAQHAVALLLSLANKITLHHNWMLEGLWRRGDSFACSYPLRNRTVGLLGYGAVNSKVHNFLSGFDIHFSILKRNWDDEIIDLPTGTKKYTTDQLHNFLDEIDVLVIAVPHTKETENLIGEKELKLLGSEGLVVNIARGKIIDEESLFIALKNKIIMGAAIDVWYNYQPKENGHGKKFPYSFPFYKLENIILSPHRGASPMNDLKRWDEVIENIKRFASGRTDFLNVVNLYLEY